jgi:hypothetical protein
MRTQKGFAALEALLLFVIIAIIGGTGWYVFKSKDAINQTYDSAGSLKSQSVSNVKVADTSKWIAYSSTGGHFSLKYPDNWVTASNPSACSDGIALFGPDEQSVGKCATENFGQISVVSIEAASVDSSDLSTDPGFKNVKVSTVNVDSVSGKRIQVTAANDPGGEGDFSVQAGPTAYPVGTKVVEYLFYTNGRAYVATYIQKPTGSRDVMADFDTMMTMTFKFQ